MNRRLHALGFVLAALVVASCGRPDGGVAGRDHIKFRHGTHLGAGIGCTRCHSGTSATTGNADSPRMDQWAGRPTEAQCRGCHSQRPEQQRCDFCHTQPQAPRPYERVNRDLRFSHTNHAPRVRGNCMTCHGAGANMSSLAAFSPTIPHMDTCATRCHGADMRALNCSRCHTSLRRFAMDEISTPRHGPGYARHHGAEARAMANACSQCHEVTFCSRCHSAAPGMPVADLDPMAVTRDFVHRGDFFARHSDEARFQTNSCTRCHGVEFCDGCHRTSGIGGGVGPGNTHPPGWLNPGSPNGHAREARRNLLSCVACHESDAVAVCTPCHRVGGAAPNPHPPGFRAGIDQNQHSICLVCHAGAP